MAEVLKANANGFILSQRYTTGIMIASSPITLGETEETPGANFGKLKGNATHANNLKAGTTEGDANLSYLKNSSSIFTIKNKQYRGISVIGEQQKIGESDNTDGIVGADVHTDDALCFTNFAASPGEKFRKKKFIDFLRSKE